MKTIGLLDYGVGNLLSVARALNKCDLKVEIVTTPPHRNQFDTLVLPGVGAFPKAMLSLHETGLYETLLSHAKMGRPLIGICLGMQLLMENSEEFGTTLGLSLIPGKVSSLPKTTLLDTPIRIPHIGWSALNFISERQPMWSRFQNAHMYFVHSFSVATKIAQHTIAHTQYCGVSISSIIQKDNIIGCQFHPEKSGPVGLELLKHMVHLPA